MKINQAALGKPCEKCRRTITQDVIDLIVGLKKQNAINSSIRAKINGHKLGRKAKPIDWQKAKELREKYYSFSRIGKELGINRLLISRGFKKRGWK